MKKIIIIGAGGFGKEIVDLIECIGGFDIVGFLDDDIKKINTYVNNVKVLDKIENIYKYKDVENIVIAAANPLVKYKIYEFIKKIGFNFPNLIHPSVLMGSNIKMGIGNIICANSIISTEAALCDFVAVNPQCGIGHESVICSFSTLYWNVIIGGNTIINKKCELGTKSCVLQGLNLIENVTIGAGAVVVKDINKEGIYIGVPAEKYK